MAEKTALIIGAGPAGLTAAYELLEHTSVRPIVLEATGEIGGIARTVHYKGNRIDIGGHRFFSKSDRVMDWWLRFLPLQRLENGQAGLALRYRGAHRDLDVCGQGPDPDETDLVMLVRNRLSRIFFLRRFFDYPVTLNFNTMANLGPVRLARIAASLARARIAPIRRERSLEDFLVNRFGRELYLTFFKDYTEKVWGVPCDRISPEWGAQRIKGLSLTGAVWHAVRRLVRRDGSIAQKSVETSLIDRFLYPKFGPGQLWEHVAGQIRRRGGEIRMGHVVERLFTDGRRVTAVGVREDSGREVRVTADFFLSSMPVQDLVRGLHPAAPPGVREVAEGLMYRDFITVGLLLRGLKAGAAGRAGAGDGRGLIPDNWIYIQERDVRVGRLQVFNNWSPYMVADPRTCWLGLEYFCQAGDELWSMSDGQFAGFAADELAKIDLIDRRDVLDAVVIRVPRTYPAYFGSYDRFEVIRRFLDGFENLFLVGRNGMHRYNNQDHSMLTAMAAVENIRDGSPRKDNIWDVNVEQEYHEERGGEKA